MAEKNTENKAVEKSTTKEKPKTEEVQEVPE